MKYQIVRTQILLQSVIYIFLSSCSIAHAEALPRTETLKLVIGYIPHIQFAPLYVGLEKGMYLDRQIELKIEYGFGSDIFGLLLQEKIDLGLSDSDQLILSGANDLGLVALLQYYQKIPVTIVAKRQKIKSPEDFRGKRIGTPMMAGTNYIGLEVFLQHYQLKNAVMVENIGYTQITSLLHNDIDGAVCFLNNEPVKLRQLGTEISQWDIREFSNIIGGSFITSRALTQKRRDVLGRFTEATIAAMEYTCKHQEDAIQLSLPYLDQYSEQPDYTLLRGVLASTCQLLDSSSGYGALDPKAYADSIETLYQLSLIESVYPARKILFNPVD